MIMTSARDRILGKLRAAQQPFKELPPAPPHRYMSRPKDVSAAALRARFTDELKKLSCIPSEHADAESALDYILGVVGEDKSVIGWDFAAIPLKGLKEALDKRGIAIAHHRDDKVRVGITGADAAFASTGSLMMTSGAGKPRTASLLPLVHIAVITASQILPDFDTWIEQRRAEGIDSFNRAANNYIISGSSRTADIAMESVIGVHGPGEVHAVILV
jgi:L-lactate dehydrogenase complex protein LldG